MGSVKASQSISYIALVADFLVVLCLSTKFYGSESLRKEKPTNKNQTQPALSGQLGSDFEI
jgi:hypothetical protein